MGKSGKKGKSNARGSFPVGKVNFLNVTPMSFMEFVRAVDNPFRLKALETGDWNLIGSLRNDFETLLRKYLFVGGMPEAVEEFSESGNAEVDFVVQGESDVFPIEAKAGINTKAKSLKVYRELFNPPYAIRTSLQPYNDGGTTKDIPLYAFGSQLMPLIRHA